MKRSSLLMKFRRLPRAVLHMKDQKLAELNCIVDRIWKAHERRNEHTLDITGMPCAGKQRQAVDDRSDTPRDGLGGRRIFLRNIFKYSVEFARSVFGIPNPHAL